MPVQQGAAHIEAIDLFINSREGTYPWQATEVTHFAGPLNDPISNNGMYLQNGGELSACC